MVEREDGMKRDDGEERREKMVGRELHFAWEESHLEGASKTLLLGASGRTAFQYTITYGTFVKRRATAFQIVPQIREHLEKRNGITVLNGRNYLRR
jgi:hypothetical protein